MSKYDLACEIHDNGEWEEFYQKRGNWFMYDYHKAKRIKLQKEYQERFN